MKGQLGTQVKDASLSELGNPSLDRPAGSKKGRVRRGEVAPAGPRRNAGASGGAAPSPAPGRCSPAGVPAPGSQRVTYLPTVWLASWRMRLNCFFIVAPLPR